MCKWLLYLNISFLWHSKTFFSICPGLASGQGSCDPKLELLSPLPPKKENSMNLTRFIRIRATFVGR